MLKWSCRKCGAVVAEEYTSCPTCGSDPSRDAPADARGDCLRCEGTMRLGGTLKLHEGTRLWPLLIGNLGELMVNRETFETHVCDRCGKVEFYVPPVVDDGRP